LFPAKTTTFNKLSNDLITFRIVTIFGSNIVGKSIENVKNENA